jgi:enediyne biosynthesis protein E4
MRIQNNCAMLLSILLVACFSFVSIGIIFAESPNSFEFQAVCSGPVNGLWNYSAKEHGTCTCPDSIPLPSFDPGYAIDVCQNGNNLSATIPSPIPELKTQFKGSASGQQVNFSIITKYTLNSGGSKLTENLTNTHKGSAQGNAISGSVSSNWKFNFSGGGTSFSCSCNLNGTFNVQINGSGNPPPPPPPPNGGGDPSTQDVSQTSGIANQAVETTSVQWTDINNDNKIDLSMIGNNISALFKNIGADKFSQVNSPNTSQALIGAAWADFDNDGDADVVLFDTLGQVIFLENAKGSFNVSQLSSSKTGITKGGMWLDFNNDGKVDAYLIKDGAPNQLYKNQGGGHFEEVAAAAHADVTGPGRSAVAADFNGDGFADIYVVNFHAKNKLLINNGNGTFRETSGAPFVGASVQAIVGDYNNDKKFDILVVNSAGASAIFKNTGNDAAGNPKFVKANVGINGPTHGAAAAFADFNNDGFLDLVLVQSSGGNILFRNKGDGTFGSVGTVNLNNPQDPTSITTGDFNNDGLVDIMIGDGTSSQTNGDSLFKNNSNKNHWVEVALQGTKSNRSAITAIVDVNNGGKFQARIVSGGNGQNQDSLVLHFGLGANTKIDEMEIFWPGGVPQRCTNIKVDRIVKIKEGSPSSAGCQ